MIRLIENSVSSELPSSLDGFLHDFAQVKGDITYNDIINLGKCWRLLPSTTISSIKKDISTIRKTLREDLSMDLWEFCNEDPELNSICDNLVTKIKSSVNAYLDK